jgi:hypothetical protein
MKTRIPGMCLAAAALATGACAATMESDGAIDRGEEMAQCDATPAQSMIGVKADSATGAKILALTGAEILRWAPPNSALTMDYRANRVTVSYDEAMVIDRISCG